MNSSVLLLIFILLVALVGPFRVLKLFFLLMKAIVLTVDFVRWWL
jgi:hypothetical protein